MKVEFVLFAEAVNKSASGTLNILGEFNTLFSEEFPFVRPGLVFIVRLKGEQADREPHLIRAELVKKGTEFKLAEFEAAALQQTDRPQDPRGDIILNAYGLVFPEAGEYAMNVYVDGELSGERPLYVQTPPLGKS